MQDSLILKVESLLQGLYWWGLLGEIPFTLYIDQDIHLVSWHAIKEKLVGKNYHTILEIWRALPAGTL